MLISYLKKTKKQQHGDASKDLRWPTVRLLRQNKRTVIDVSPIIAFGLHLLVYSRHTVHFEHV